MMDKNKKDPQTYRIIGSAMEVHRELGCGFLEAVYQEALEKEFKKKEIKNKREIKIPIYYKKDQLDTYYKVDFICFDIVIVELKAINKIGTIEEAQVINYLKATGYDIGLILNFGSSSLEYKRIIFQNLRIEL